MKLKKHDPEEVLRQFTGCEPADTEHRMGEASFTDYAFYQSIGRNQRACYFTCCNMAVTACKATDVYQEEYLLGLRHNVPTICPFCGCMVVGCCTGRLRLSKYGDSYKSLNEKRNAAFLEAWDNGLLISAGKLKAEWSPGEAENWPIADLGLSALERIREVAFPQRDLDYQEVRRYFIAPGEVLSWKLKWEKCQNENADAYWKSNWVQLKRTQGSPFLRWSVMNRDPEDGQYCAIGVDAIAQSGMKYCAIDRYLGDPLADGLYGRELVAYLINYIRHPQIEILVKMGFREIIADLLDGEWHRDLLNWSAKTPAAFFRMNRPDFTLFHRAGGTLEDLQLMQEMEGIPYRDYLHQKERLAACRRSHEIARCQRMAQRCGVSLHRAVSYALKITSIQDWEDYYNAAFKLDYDLTREDVSMPKELAKRHDEAIAAVKHQEDIAARADYRKERFPWLQMKYGFEWQGLRIVVPEDEKEIIQEGKCLKHCVGGYAPRHMKGVTTILFLRRVENIDAPYVTIEMNGCVLVQAHGYQNERDGAVAPTKRHKEFFTRWLTWLSAGSHRMKNGAPLLNTPKKEASA